MTAAPVLTSALKYKVTVFNGKTPGQSYVFDKSVVTVGRGPENDIVLSNDSRMSRNHFEIRLAGGQLSVRNLSQKNFITVDGERLEEKNLLGTSILQAGETTLQIQIEESAKPALQPLSSSDSDSGSESDRTLILQMPPSVSAAAAPVLAPASPRTPPPVPTSRNQAPISSVSSSAPTYAEPFSPAAPSKKKKSSSSASAPRRVSAGVSRGGDSRVRFYAIIAIVGGLLYWVMASETGKKKTEVNIRTEGDVTRAIEESARAVQEIQKKQSSSGQDSVQYKAAQEHYIRGFRDYRQGQFARAMQSFQAALSFYPSHELARKYYVQSQRKFEAQIDFALSQGRKYYQKNNFKMCQSSFASVMIMLKDSSKPKYKEAKQLYEECSLRYEERY